MCSGADGVVGVGNAGALERELAWFDAVLHARISLHFEQECAYAAVEEIAAPALDGDDSDYARLVREFGLDFRERLLLMLALVPHLRPQALDMLFLRNRNLDRGFTEFGGWKGRTHGGFLPTCETAAFLLAGTDLGKRFAVLSLLDAAHPLVRRGVLRIDHDARGEPQLSGSLTVSPEYLARVTTGAVQKPDYDVSFPAKLITTPLAWDDLVLGRAVQDEIAGIRTWATHGDKLLGEWRLEKTVKPGYRSLFYGPPGTGKTLTATLIGQSSGADVYRIDLSMIVSKYIGETEKNLANVFDQAQHRRWILFFDEADALFGKRTSASSSNDRHANQEVAYLLQRVEDFPGIVILATNLKANIDDAFARRFQSLVYFPMPDAEQRLRLWKGTLNPTGRLAPDVDLELLARQHEISGGAITNVARDAAINAMQVGREQINMADLRRGIARELRKEGRTA
ncbi:ATP-binding protein [Ramlibacter sp.]|uniref:ATP-binding protein n=1 Tax=Ramlibacter sp. TaxID=1917967 RepID=UPI00179EB738|nr:ATP-binding protein [Ramlibacter sp.]MBA2675284.1 ATP-binding protein [Ramlibacter sp.]